MPFSLGELDITDKVGIGYFFVFGGGVSGYKEDGIVPVNVFGGETGFTPTCAKRKIRLLWIFPELVFWGRIREFVGRIWSLWLC